jgi:hypothetical protein
MIDCKPVAKALASFAVWTVISGDKTANGPEVLRAAIVR